MRSKKPSCHDNQYTTSPHQKTANENRWGAHAVLLWLHTGWESVFLHQGLSGQCARGAQSSKPTSGGEQLLVML